MYFKILIKITSFKTCIMRKILSLKQKIFTPLFLIATNVFSQNVVTVTDCNLNGWVKQTQPGTSLTFKNGVGTPPLGKGSIEFSSPNVNFVRFRNTAYNNTPLSSITEFGYSTYVQNREDNVDVNYVILLIDKNNDGVTDDNLVFDPRYQSQPYTTNHFPDQGKSQVGVWQYWDMLHGLWWPGPPPKPDPDHGGPVFTLAEYIAQNPNARIINDPALGGGGIRLTGGAVPGIFAPNFIGNADNFRIGVNGVTTIYDFEFTTANAGEDKNVIYGYGSNCTMLNGVAAGGVAPYTYLWSGGSTPNAASTEVCLVDTTTYTLTVTDANGCVRTDDVTVNVNDVRCGRKMDKVKVCHRGREICVAKAFVPLLLKHGFTLGSCPQKLCDNMNSEPDKETTELASQLRLSNYPNPFTASTRIEYELPDDGNVSIKVFDLFGREITTLVNGNKKQGKYYVDFGSAGLQAGIYYYRLTLSSGADFFTQTNKMVIAH